MITLRDVTRSVPTGRVIVKPTNLTVKPGELLVLKGKSGAGKSSLLSLVGLLEKPSSGTVSIANEIVNYRNDRALSRIRANHIGFLFQSIHLLLERSVIENVMFGLLGTRITVKERRHAAWLALLEVGMEGRCDAIASELSGGERQRVALARARIRDSSILLCDEPTGSLDSVSGRLMADLIWGEAESGKAVIVVTHGSDFDRHPARFVNMVDGALDA